VKVVRKISSPMTETWWEILFWQCTELGDPLIANEKAGLITRRRRFNLMGHVYSVSLTWSLTLCLALMLKPLNPFDFVHNFVLVLCYQTWLFVWFLEFGDPSSVFLLLLLECVVFNLSFFKCQGRFLF
jgi:hypothetical protein